LAAYHAETKARKTERKAIAEPFAQSRKRALLLSGVRVEVDHRGEDDRREAAKRARGSV